MLKLCACLAVVLVGAAVGSAAAAPSAPAKPQKSYVLVTAFQFRGSVLDACTGACARTADAERAKTGPEPAAPFYRASAAHSEALRKKLGKDIGRAMGIDDASSLIPSRSQMIKDWVSLYPVGGFRPDDLADVIAKYWLFAWMTSTGMVDESRISDAAKEGVRTQTHALVARDPILSSLTEAQRQSMAEFVMARQDADDLVFMEQAKAKDLKAISQTMETVRTQFQALYGLDLRKLALTQGQGFAIESGAAQP